MLTLRSLSLLAAAALSVVGVTVLTTAAATAHEGKAIITVDTTTPGADGSISYELRVVWDNDGHPAKDATITAVADGPGGSRVGPVVMENVDEDGHYTGTVQFPAPGSWLVRFTVVEPPGSLEVPQVIGAPTKNALSTTAPSTTASPTIASTGTTTPAATERAADTTDQKSSGGNWGFIGAVAVVLIGAAMLYFRNRRHTDTPSG